MGFTEVRDGLCAVVEGVSGIPVVLKYEPSSVQVHKATWVLLDSYQRKQFGQVTTMTYRFMVRVATPIQDAQSAEDELIAVALSVADAVDANPQFGSAILRGLASSPDGQTGWIVAGGTKCRVVDVFVEVLDKSPYAGAL
jgi:hypothetical protein